MPVSGRTEIRALALFASPKKTGASSALHECFLSGLGPASIVRVHLYDRIISPCTACGHCSGRRECVFQDDMTPLYDELSAADILSISMPLYFSAPPAPLKLFIDRTQVLWEAGQRGEHQHKAGAMGFLICTGGGRYKNMFLPTVTIIRHFFNSAGFKHDKNDFLLFSGMEGLKGTDVSNKHLSRARMAGEALGKLYKRGGYTAKR